MYYFEKDLDNKQGYDNTIPVVAATREEANLEGSKQENGKHIIQLDLDVPHEYIPSSTPGHAHLVFRQPVFEEDYYQVLRALQKVGIIEKGYLNCALKRGQTFLRLPEVKKGDTAKITERRKLAEAKRALETNTTERENLLKALAELEKLA